MIMLKRLVWLAALTVVAAPLSAQEVSSPFGDRITPTDDPPVGLLDAERPTVYFLSPLLASADGIQLGKGTAGVILNANTEKPLKLSANYTYLDPDGADSLDRLGFAVNYRFLRGRTYKLALLGEYADGDHLPQRVQAGVYGEVKIGHWAATATVQGAQNKSGGKTVDDVLLKPGVIFNITERLAVGADYTFDNDILGDDDYSAAVNFGVSPSLSLTGLAGKDDLVGLLMFLSF